MNRPVEQTALRNLQSGVAFQQSLLHQLLPVCNDDDVLLLQAMLRYPLPLPDNVLRGLITLFISQCNDAQAVAFIQRTLTGRISIDIALELGDANSIWVLLCQSCDARILRSVVYRFVLELDTYQTAGRLGYPHTSPLARHYRLAADVVGWAKLPLLKHAAVWKSQSRWRIRLEADTPMTVTDMEVCRLLTLGEGEIDIDAVRTVEAIDAEAFWKAAIEADYEPGLRILALRLGYQLNASEILKQMGIRTTHQEDPTNLLNRRLVRLSKKMAQQHYLETVRLTGIISGSSDARKSRRMGDQPAPLNDRIQGLLMSLSQTPLTAEHLNAFKTAVLDGLHELPETRFVTTTQPGHAFHFWYSAALCANTRQMRLRIDTQVRGLKLYQQAQRDQLNPSSLHKVFNKTMTKISQVMRLDEARLDQTHLASDDPSAPVMEYIIHWQQTDSFIPDDAIDAFRQKVLAQPAPGSLNYDYLFYLYEHLPKRDLPDYVVEMVRSNARNRWQKREELYI